MGSVLSKVFPDQILEIDKIVWPKTNHNENEGGQILDDQIIWLSAILITFLNFY